MLTDIVLHFFPSSSSSCPSSGFSFLSLSLLLLLLRDQTVEVKDGQTLRGGDVAVGQNDGHQVDPDLDCSALGLPVEELRLIIGTEARLHHGQQCLAPHHAGSGGVAKLAIKKERKKERKRGRLAM